MKSTGIKRRGRPVRPGRGVWRHAGVLTSRVTTIVAPRDKDNEETLTDVLAALRRLGLRLGLTPAFMDSRRGHLRRLVLTAKPSCIARIFLSWRFGLPDRTVRRLQQRGDILEVRWA